MNKTRSRRSPERGPVTKVAAGKPPPARYIAPAATSPKWDITAAVKATFPLLLIFVLGFSVYLPSLDYPLENLDEPVIIGRNLQFLTDFSNVQEALLRDAFFSKEKEFYRPVQNLSYMLDAQLAHGQPSGFRFMNLLLHCLTCSALYWLLRVLKFGTILAALLACLFTVHPLFTHVVVWTPSRGDILLALFGITALICLIRFLQTGNRVYCAVHIALSFSAMFSKETAAVLPSLFLAYGFLVHRPKSIKILAIPVAGDFVAVFIFLLVRHQLIKATVSSQIFGLEPFLFNLPTIPEVVAKFFLPINLSPMAVFSTKTTLLGLVCITLLLVAIYLRVSSRPFNRLFLFCGLWFLCILVPGMMYRHELGSSAYDYLEHRAYLPAVGLVLIIAGLIGKQTLRRPVLFGGVLCLAVFTPLSFKRSQDYRSSVAFYDAVIRANPNNSLAHSDRGIARYKSGDSAGALEDYDTAIRLAPHNDKAFNNRGNMRFRLNDFVSAKKDYDEAIRLNPKSAEPYNGRAVIEFQTRQYAAAEEDFTRSIALDPRYPDPYNGRGSVYATLGNTPAAQRDFEEAIRLKPDFSVALANLNRLKQAAPVTLPIPAANPATK